eukprot:COSAG01_NODE_2397_length_7771_cov_12.578076_1_plen_104_part_00
MWSRVGGQQGGAGWLVLLLPCQLPAWAALRTSARAAILICAAAALASFFTLILSSLDISSTLCRGCLISAIVLPSSSAFCAPPPDTAAPTHTAHIMFIFRASC